MKTILSQKSALFALMALILSSQAFAITATRVEQINQFVADLKMGRIKNIDEIKNKAAALKQGLSTRELGFFQIEQLNEAVAQALEKEMPETIAPIEEEIVAPQETPIQEKKDASFALLKKDLKRAGVKIGHYITTIATFDDKEFASIEERLRTLSELLNQHLSHPEYKRNRQTLIHLTELFEDAAFKRMDTASKETIALIGGTKNDRDALLNYQKILRRLRERLKEINKQESQTAKNVEEALTQIKNKLEETKK